MTSARARVSLRRVGVLLLDLGVVSAAYRLAFLFRFDFDLSGARHAQFASTLPYVWIAYLCAALASRLYLGIQAYASAHDLENRLKTAGLCGLLSAAAILALGPKGYPRSALLMHPFLVFCGLGSVRFCIIKGKTLAARLAAMKSPARRLVLVGAGEMGDLLMTRLLKNRSPRYLFVGIIDDDPKKRGMLMHGVRVCGGRGELPALLRTRSVDEIVIAIAAGRRDIVRAVVESVGRCPQQPEIKVSPSLEETLRSAWDRVMVRKVRPADLLNREEVPLDEARIGRTLRGKAVLVTGAGGTIGAELCRQSLRFGPERLVLLESHATALFYLEKELRAAGDRSPVVPVLGDVRDAALLERVFSEHRPQVVLHAAAHKHVFQLEANVHEGVSNNTLGTYRLAGAAHRHGAEVFLLVSTDKAVRPSSVMGATKRAAEIVVKSMAASSRTRFVAVRFGNVLGSSGSVLRIFKEQIEKGEPITLTDPGATRYFMTVEEAVGLILQSAAIASSGDICVLRMGEPVRIMDMAKNLIVLAGLQPGRDVPIKLTGLRQGEKLHEELVEDPAGVDVSEHPEIMRLRAENAEVQRLPERMRELEAACGLGDAQTLLARLTDLVPTFRPAAGHGLRPDHSTREAT